MQLHQSNKKEGARSKEQGGMTLAEILVALAIFVVVMMAVATFEVNIFTYNGNIAGSLQTAQDAQVILKTMLREMREISPGANGSYPLISAATSSISFFSDPDNDGMTEQITYTLTGTKLYRAVIQPSGSPATYPIANQATTTLVTNVRNGNSTPIFQYFDTNYNGTSTPLSLPVTTTAVRLVKISLTLDVDPNRSPVPVTYTTQASFRNLKSNL